MSILLKSPCVLLHNQSFCLYHSSDPVMVACQQPNIPMVKLLIELKANLDKADLHNNTPLFYANTSLTKLLIKAGASLELSYTSETVLHDAFIKNQVDKTKELLMAGANLTTIEDQNLEVSISDEMTTLIVTSGTLFYPEGQVSENYRRWMNRPVIHEIFQRELLIFYPYFSQAIKNQFDRQQLLPVVDIFKIIIEYYGYYGFMLIAPKKLKKSRNILSINRHKPECIQLRDSFLTYFIVGLTVVLEKDITKNDRYIAHSILTLCNKIQSSNFWSIKLIKQILNEHLDDLNKEGYLLTLNSPLYWQLFDCCNSSGFYNKNERDEVLFILLKPIIPTLTEYKSTQQSAFLTISQFLESSLDCDYRKPANKEEIRFFSPLLPLYQTYYGSNFMETLGHQDPITVLAAMQHIDNCRRPLNDFVVALKKHLEMQFSPRLFKYKRKPRVKQFFYIKKMTKACQSILDHRIRWSIVLIKIKLVCHLQMFKGNTRLRKNSEVYNIFVKFITLSTIFDSKESKQILNFLTKKKIHKHSSNLFSALNCDPRTSSTSDYNTPQYLDH